MTGDDATLRYHRATLVVTPLSIVVVLCANLHRSDDDEVVIHVPLHLVESLELQTVHVTSFGCRSNDDKRNPNDGIVASMQVLRIIVAQSPLEALSTGLVGDETTLPVQQKQGGIRLLDVAGLSTGQRTFIEGAVERAQLDQK